MDQILKRRLFKYDVELEGGGRQDEGTFDFEKSENSPHGIKMDNLRKLTQVLSSMIADMLCGIT